MIVHRDGPWPRRAPAAGGGAAANSTHGDASGDGAASWESPDELEVEVRVADDAEDEGDEGDAPSASATTGGDDDDADRVERGEDDDDGAAAAVELELSPAAWHSLRAQLHAQPRVLTFPLNTAKV